MKGVTSGAGTVYPSGAPAVILGYLLSQDRTTRG
jgi:hypothetical protein